MLSIDKIIERFKGDLNSYKPVPFWSWNAELEPEELCRQIRKMKQDEVGGYFMHARMGLTTEYLGEKWMECVKACANLGEELGMDSWGYDENGFPSGFAGGKLLEDIENHDRILKAKTGDFDKDALVSYLIDGDELKRVTSGEEKGEYLNLYIKMCTSTVDILNPEVTQKFIDLTHEKYKEVFGDDFSKKIKGFFTDEPEYQRYGTAYTPVLPEFYKETYGEDIFDGLGLLFLKKKGYKAFRHRYWKSMQALMLKNYAKKVYDWCNENGVEFTGHYIEETTLGFQITCCGGVMPYYEFMHMPGIDWLTAGTGKELSPRQVASAAAQMGKKHVLTETFAACGWQITPRDLKRVAEFQVVAGVNLICHHLLPYAEYGQRKRDYPSHFSSVNPWIDKEFAEFNRYFTRLGYLIAESKEVGKVAVLHPIRTAYLDFDSEDDANIEYGLKEYDEKIAKTLRDLSSAGVNYHFLDETLLATHGFVDGEKIGCGKCDYEYLILPYIENMDAITEKLIRQYVKNGGKVCILGQAPTLVEGEEFDLSYIKENCSFEEIVAAQNCIMKNRDTEIFMTHREIEGTQFVFATNTSTEKSYTQTFNIKGATAFEKLDLLTLERKIVPLTVEFEAGESAILFPVNAQVKDCEKQTEVSLKLENAKVDFSENSLTIDAVRYSTDGVNYSEKYPVVALFEKLVNERFEGDIYFKYEFDVKEVPNEIRIKAEKCDCPKQWLNGNEFEFEKVSKVEANLLVADISRFVKEGTNEFVQKTKWFQSERVYWTLFSEDATEGLKNMLAYDSELEAVYVCGKFGVYTDTGFTDSGEGFVCADNFYIGAEPQTVSEIVTDGFPFFKGEMTLKQTVTLENKNVALRIDGTQQVAYIKVNGLSAGKLLFNTTLDISKFAKVGENEIEVTLVISNRNLLGPHHYNGVLSRTVSAPDIYEVNNSWKENKSDMYLERFELLTLGIAK